MEFLKDLQPATLMLIAFIVFLLSTVIQKILLKGVDSMGQMKRPDFGNFQEIITTTSATHTAVEFIKKEFGEFKELWNEMYDSLIKRLDNHEIRLTNIELNAKRNSNIKEINKKKCILIEDEKIMSEMLLTHLSRDFVVDSTDDPDKAIEFIKNKKYDFAMCDILLKNKSGLKFWHYCLKNNRLINFKNGNKKIKIILYSGRDPGKLPALPPNAEFLHKPFQWDELELKINYLLY